MNNKDLVQTAGTELFIDRDPSAIDRWWAADYRQHSAMAGDGPGFLRGMVEKLPPDFRFEPVRLLADGDLVAMHGTYYGFGPLPLVAFDVFRVADGKLAEHWDALQPVVAETASGRSQVDGPAEVTAPEQTEASRAVVLGFVEAVLKGGKIVEHWDVVAEIPESLPHGNGLF